MVAFMFNTVICVFLSLCLCILIICLCLHHAIWHTSATLTEAFLCFFLSCKANDRVNPAKMGHGPHSSKLWCCSMYCLCCVVLFIVFK